MKQLIGFSSPETAYVVEDYPYGFVLRTSIRYWIETSKKRGQRFVSQTLNPKTGEWNKPKASTYDPVVVMGLDEKGHVTVAKLTFYDLHGTEKAEAFAREFELDGPQKQAIAYNIVLNKRIAEAYQTRAVAQEVAK